MIGLLVYVILPCVKALPARSLEGVAGDKLVDWLIVCFSVKPNSNNSVWHL
jgi:hypothetical protein